MNSDRPTQTPVPENTDNPDGFIDLSGPGGVVTDVRTTPVVDDSGLPSLPPTVHRVLLNVAQMFVELDPDTHGYRLVEDKVTGFLALTDGDDQMKSRIRANLEQAVAEWNASFVTADNIGHPLP